MFIRKVSVFLNAKFHTQTVGYKLKKKMKSILILLFILFLVQTSCGQDKLKIERSANSRLIKVLNNSELIGENRANNLSIRIYKIDNGSGSAGIAEGHEVSHNLLIAVSEFDEEPKQNLFEIGPFYNAKFVKWIGEKEYQKEFEIEYGDLENRKSIILNVNIDKVKME